MSARWRDDRNKHDTMERRKFLVGAGSIGAAAVTGTALLSGSATANSEGTFDVEEVHGSSVDGSLSEINVTVDGTYSYSDLPDDAESVTIELQVFGEDGAGYTDTETIASTSNEDSGTDEPSGTSGEGLEFADIEGDVLSHGYLSASDFEAEDFGETVENDVILKLETTVETADDEVVGVQEEDLTVIMENMESTAGTGATANTTIET